MDNYSNAQACGQQALGASLSGLVGCAQAEPPRTINEILSMQEKSLMAKLAEIEAFRAKMPAAVLQMTEFDFRLLTRQIW